MERPVRQVRQSIIGIAAALTAALAAITPAAAYTEKEVTAIFRTLDTNGDGKVTREDYSANKIAIIYRNVRGRGGNITFEQTKLSRAFFDAADVDHDGALSPVEIVDALPFEAADTDSKGYITLDDLRRFLNRIGR
jgi:hypothetical protein